MDLAPTICRSGVNFTRDILIFVAIRSRFVVALEYDGAQPRQDALLKDTLFRDMS